jgi:hypothetical protein
MGGGSHNEACQGGERRCYPKEARSLRHQLIGKWREVHDEPGHRVEKKSKPEDSPCPASPSQTAMAARTGECGLGVGPGCRSRQAIDEDAICSVGDSEEQGPERPNCIAERSTFI